MCERRPLPAESVPLCFLRIVAMTKTEVVEYLDQNMPGHWAFTRYKWKVGKSPPRRDIPMSKNLGTPGYRLNLGVFVGSAVAAVTAKLMLPQEPVFGLDPIGLHSIVSVDVTPETRSFIFAEEYDALWRDVDRRPTDEEVLRTLVFPWEAELAALKSADRNV